MTNIWNSIDHQLFEFNNKVIFINNIIPGLLQSNTGSILKPILKESQRREIDFYERLRATDDPDLIELRSFVPRYKGCKKFTYNNYENEYLILEDLTENMVEPCIMDVKIGRRTWDPLATEGKIASEKSKYALCRQEYAFCIPGFQVYRIPSGKLHKYGKEYGKKLHGAAVKDGEEYIYLYVALETTPYSSRILKNVPKSVPG